MTLEKEFNKYVNKISNKIGYDITSEELDTLYKSFFDENIGIMNHLVISRIQDMMFEKEKQLNKDIEISKENEYVC